MDSQLKPRSRQEGLLVREMVSGEHILYDMESHEAHCLNRTSAMVRALCDGSRTPQEIASAMTMELDQSFDEELVKLALAELDDAGLLEEMAFKLWEAAVLTRREAMGRIGKGALIATLVPLITTILAPTPAAAGSCGATGAACTSGFDCCSGICVSNQCV